MRTLPLNRGGFSSFSISEVLNHHALGSLGSWGTFQVDPQWPYMERTEKVTRRWSRCAHKEAGAEKLSAAPHDCSMGDEGSSNGFGFV